MPPAKKLKLRSWLLWLLLLPIPAFWCVLDHYDALTWLENKTEDWRFRVRGEMTPPVKVVYADIDSLSLSQIGQFPWSRDIHEAVASALVNEAKVKAVGFDIVFSDTLGVSEAVDWRGFVKGNFAFGRFLTPSMWSRPPPVVLAAAYGGWQFVDVRGRKEQRVLPVVERIQREKRPLNDIEKAGPELPAFELSADPDRHNLVTPGICGLIDTLNDGTREVPAYAPSGVQTYFHMALQLARLYWGLPPGSIKVAGDHIDFVRPDGKLVARVPLEHRQYIHVNWFTKWISQRTEHVEFSTLYSYALDLASKDAAARANAKRFFADPGFRDAVVLVGPVDPLLHDLAPTSLDPTPVPRVGVHGNLLMTIISGKYLKFVPPSGAYAITFILSLLMATLAITGGARAIFAKAMAVLVALLYLVFAFYVFDRMNLVLPLATPLSAAFTTSFAGLIWQVVEEQKAKGRIKGMFGTYLAPTVVEQMIESGRDPELGGHDSEITAYFSDIQSFSSFSEVLSSSKLGELLNEYLTACTDIVQGERGTLDKYIGDAVVAMFGAPVEASDHAYRACLVSQLVQARIAELRRKWRSEGDKWPPPVHHLRTRIGLNTGVCMIGNMGSRTRFNYTMMGDNVNLAARMESGAKHWGVYSMCTESTRQACVQRGGDRIVFRSLAKIVVKGRSQPVPVFEVMGLRENVSDAARECIGTFEQGLARYYAREWDGALEMFARSRSLEPNQPDRSTGISGNPSLEYEHIVAESKESPPPADWDGRYVMKEK